MALHPDDPPIPEALGGVAQICSTMEQFRRIFDMGGPAEHGMVFCQGCMTELLGAGVYDAIEEMSSAGRVAWVHFRNVRGVLPRFAEVFIDEGDIDIHKALSILHRNEFDGVIIPDHTPEMSCAAPWHAGMAFAMGYLKATLENVTG